MFILRFNNLSSTPITPTTFLKLYSYILYILLYTVISTDKNNMYLFNYFFRRYRLRKRRGLMVHFSASAHSFFCTSTSFYFFSFRTNKTLWFRLQFSVVLHFYLSSFYQFFIGLYQFLFLSVYHQLLFQDSFISHIFITWTLSDPSDCKYFLQPSELFWIFYVLF